MCVCVCKKETDWRGWLMPSLCMERRRSGGPLHLWSDWPLDQVGESVFSGIREMCGEMERACPLESDLRSSSSSVVYKLGNVGRLHGFPGFELPRGGWRWQHLGHDVSEVPPTWGAEHVLGSPAHKGATNHTLLLSMWNAAQPIYWNDDLMNTLDYILNID